MLISAGGSSGGRGLVSASGIDSPPSPSPPPAMRHSPRPRLPPPLSAESRASPPLKGRIVRLEEAAASGRQKASCQPHRRHPCRRASAAFVAALIEMEARGGGFVSPPGLAGLRSRGGGSQGAHPQPRSPRAASAPVAIGKAASPVSDLERIQRSSRFPAAAWHPAAVGGGVVPPRRPPVSLRFPSPGSPALLLADCHDCCTHDIGEVQRVIVHPALAAGFFIAFRSKKPKSIRYLTFRCAGGDQRPCLSSRKSFNSIHDHPMSALGILGQFKVAIPNADRKLHLRISKRSVANP